ncbi:FadR/GntR family transcriptional regulator [Plastorhodobacter daqingensis]|uniref:FadR/GntR family transcriptional regulator n=1 Tax=Plastorhodobacter daqingensis TaxID=1387281 RepID=A0ABW2UND9_9RHOB
MNEIFSPVSLNKTEQVARMLLSRIINSDLRPGSSFGTEAELLAQMNVSRPTLREGLRILESQGVLTLRPGPGGGIIVTRPKVDVIAHAMSVYLRLNNVPFAEVLKARIAIEPALVRDAASNGTEAHFSEMEQTILAMESTDCSDQTIYNENRKFHSAIAKASLNPVLEAFWLTISIMASGETANIRYSRRNRSHIIQAHRRILEACRQRDPDAAQRAMSDHLGELDDLLRARFGARLAEPTRITYKAANSIE